MSGATFATKGGPGPATNTIFFGPIPDKWNMLSAMHGTASSGVTAGLATCVQDTYLASYLINSWTIFNPSFIGNPSHPTLTLGPLITAPDGTNTGQKIIESSDAGTPYIHYLSAGFFNGAASPWWSQRFQFFAKPAERTKIEALFNSETGSQGGVKVIFDLAAKTTGAITKYFDAGDPTQDWTQDCSASIAPYGNTGWLECTFDITVNGGGGAGLLHSLMLIDNSGNESYVGDGVSGLYIWKGVSLPPGAWAMSNQVLFFDDFNDNTMSNFDMGNTRGPNFRWWFNPVPNYPNHNYHGTNQASLPGDFSVSGSKLTISNVVSGNNLDMCWTAVYNETAPSQNIARDPAGVLDQRGYHSFLYQPPVLLETSTTAWNPNQGDSGQTELAVWSNNFEELCYTDNSWVGGPLGNTPITYEPTWFDCQEYQNLYPLQGEATCFTTGLGNPYVYANNRDACFGPWRAGRAAYNFGSIIWHAGVLYKAASGAVNPNVAPPAAPWSVYTPSGHVSFTPANVDFTQLQTFSTLWLVQNPNNKKDCGIFISFLNGNFSGLQRYGAFQHDPHITTGGGGFSVVWHVAESMHYTLLIQTPFPPAFGPLITDWIRASK